MQQNVSNAVVWECVKKSNAFMKKGIHGGNARSWFSSEPGNLYNRHSFKFSGQCCRQCGKPTAINGGPSSGSNAFLAFALPS